MSLKIEYKNCVIILKIFEKSYNVDVIYDLFEGEEITQAQKETADIISEVIDNCSDQIQQAVATFLNISEAEVSSLIKPRTIYIFRGLSAHEWAILADSSVDPESGLAVVFDGQRLKEVTTIADSI